MSHIQQIKSSNTHSEAALAKRQRPILAMARRIFDSFYLWQTRINDRRELAGLDERMLKDAGTSRDEVLRETGKPFWRS
jgi:uncharacterized protein YjiS (DUF1127 family)